MTGKTMWEQQQQSRRFPSPYAVFVIGLDYRSRETLYRRIDLRVDRMVEQGLLREAEEMLASPLSTSAQAIGYKELEPYFRGEKSLKEALEKLKQSSRRYAKRQLTWFRRDERVHWLYPDEEKNPAGLCEKALNIIEKSGVLCYTENKPPELSLLEAKTASDTGGK